MRVVYCLGIIAILIGQIKAQRGWYGHAKSQIDQELLYYSNLGLKAFSSDMEDVLSPFTSYHLNNSIKDGPYNTDRAAFLQLLEDRTELLVNHILNHQEDLPNSKLTESLLNEWLYQELWQEYLDWSNWSINNVDPFKMGYTLLQLNQNMHALAEFKRIKPNHPNYFDAAYYQGYYHAKNEEWDLASQLLEVASQKIKYKYDSPLILAQIYFIQQRYPEVVNQKLAQGSMPEKKANMAQIHALAFFQLNQLDQAIERFEKYIELSNQVNLDDYLLIGSALYQNNEFEKAKKYLEKIAHRKERPGQISNYYLGDIYMLSGDKENARRSFYNASKILVDTNISYQSLYYYGKLSAELNYDKQALDALQEIPSRSSLWNQSQQLISDILLTTSDYTTALEYIESHGVKSQEVNKAYQRLLYMKGIESFHNLNMKKALTYWEKSIDINLDKNTTLNSIFWSAEIYYDQKKYDLATKYYLDFISSQSKSLLASKAHFGLGYIYLKKSEKENAIAHFSQVQKDPNYPALYNDSQLKVADILFSQRNFSKAIVKYNEIIVNNSKYSDYAHLQKALILGLTNDKVRKLVILDELIQGYPESRFRDDALMESARTSLELGKPRDALKAYQKFINEYEYESILIEEALNQAGLVSYNLGSPNEAISYYKKVFQHHPKVSERKTALDALKEIYIRDLSSPDGFLNFVEDNKLGQLGNSEKDSLSYISGKIQFDLNKLERAEEAFLSYLNKFKNGNHKGQAQYFLAEIYLFKEDYDLALSYYELSCNSSAPSFDACIKAAEISYHTLEKYSKGLKYYKRSRNFASSPDENRMCITGLAKSAIELEIDSLTLLYSPLALNDEKVDESDKALLNYGLAKSLIRNKRGNDAIQFLNAVVKLSSGSWAAESRYLIAQIYFSNNQLDLAESIIENANKKNINHKFWLGKGLLLHANILTLKKDYLNARAALDAIINNFGTSSSVHIEARQRINEIDLFLNQQNKLKDVE